MKQKIDNSSGFTMIEVLIAILVLTFGLLAMGTFLGNMVSQNAKNEHKTMATSIAQHKIEDLRNEALQTDLVAADSSNVSPNTAIAYDSSGAEIGPTGTAGEIYTLSWTIDDSVITTPDEIQVRVDWDAIGNSQVVINTYINN